MPILIIPGSKTTEKLLSLQRNFLFVFASRAGALDLQPEIEAIA